jgi:hypothetical protein
MKMPPRKKSSNSQKTPALPNDAALHRNHGRVAHFARGMLMRVGPFTFFSPM